VCISVKLYEGQSGGATGRVAGSSHSQTGKHIIVTHPFKFPGHPFHYKR